MRYRTTYKSGYNSRLQIVGSCHFPQWADWETHARVMQVKIFFSRIEKTINIFFKNFLLYSSSQVCAFHWSPAAKALCVCPTTLGEPCWIVSQNYCSVGWEVNLLERCRLCLDFRWSAFDYSHDLTVRWHGVGWNDFSSHHFPADDRILINICWLYFATRRIHLAALWAE